MDVVRTTPPIFRTVFDYHVTLSLKPKCRNIKLKTPLQAIVPSNTIYEISILCTSMDN